MGAVGNKATDASPRHGRKAAQLHTFQRCFGIKTARYSLRRTLDTPDSTDETDSAKGECAETGETGKDWESKEVFRDEPSDGVEAKAREL